MCHWLLDDNSIWFGSSLRDAVYSKANVHFGFYISDTNVIRTYIGNVSILTDYVLCTNVLSNWIYNFPKYANSFTGNIVFCYNNTIKWSTLANLFLSKAQLNLKVLGTKTIKLPKYHYKAI